MSLLGRIARDRVALAGLIVIAAIALAAIFAGQLATFPQDVDTYHTAQRLLPPSAVHWFGTNQMGGDIYSRLLFGARITLVTAVIAVAVSVLIGVPMGLVAGYWSGFLGDLLMRISDIFLAVPQIVLAIAIAATLGPQIQNVILALSLTYWPFWARLVYAETRNAKSEIYIEAAIALGASPWRVMVLHILPAIAPSIIIRTSIGLGGTILTASALGFLGLGPPPPSPEWGRMIADARAFLPGAWWYAAAPGIAILILVMAFNLLGDGLRDVLDPRLRRHGSPKGASFD
ncbi:MAG TPA: ABC transporter permease [Acetobacteraceae bacterium]|nr:ABC transporter permease [Acetobacteraceae bacterium]